MSQVVLIVDDDPVQRRLLENMVQRFGYEAMTVASGDAAASILCGQAGARIDCMVLDLVMPDLDGLGVLARMRDAGRAVPVIVQTAHGGIDNVISAMRAGATDFVVKPASAERLQVSLRNALATKALAGELQRLKRSRDGTLTFADIVTRSPTMKTVLRGAEKAAASAIPALIEGESGVGKEMIARAIHGSGRPPRQAIRRRQLRRHAGKSRRVDSVRSREGLVHRRHRKPHRQSSSRPMAARCSSTRSANCRWRHR